LALLEGSPFLDNIDAANADIKGDYETICKAIPAFKDNFSQQEYAENKMLVTSRCFGITIDGKDTAIQVPFADMFNTDTPKNTYWHYDSKRNGFVVEAHRDIKMGEQLFDTYGNKCNYRYFLYYGFVKSDNHKFNEYPLKIKIQESDPVYGRKIQYFSFNSEQ
jgi:histone-lysine N-methyltransferase SETD3